MYIKVIRRQFFFICYHTQKVLSIDTKVNVWVWNKKSGRNVLVNVSCCQITESSFERESVMLFTWMGNEKEGRKGVMKRRNEGIGNILINVR